MNSLAILLAAIALGQPPAELAAAKADYAAYGPAARYLWLGGVPEDQRTDAAAALAFWLPHLSRQTVLDRQRPVRLPGTDMYRIDIDDLGWGREAWGKAGAEYPYYRAEGLGDPLRGYPGDESQQRSALDPRPSALDLLIIRVDWLLRVTADATDSSLYYDLLYAGLEVPRTKAEFLKAWRIDPADAVGLEAGVVIDEGRSGVAFRTRLLVWRPSEAGSWWETFDSRAGAGPNDPVENLAGGLKHDAQEIIVSLPKLDLASGQRGIAQAYLLVNGQGNRVDEAPTDIVVDHQRLLGQPAIRTPGSCVLCHQAVNGPGENLVRELLRAGAEISAERRSTQEFLERFYLSDLGRTVKRTNEDFAVFTHAACGRDPEAAVAAWRGVVEWYDRPLDLPQAALETQSTPDELRQAIAWYSEQLGPAAGVGRLTSLAHGRAIPRRVFEESVYQQSLTALRA